MARGFEEKHGNLLTDSPTCDKESLKILLAILVSEKWQCQSIEERKCGEKDTPLNEHELNDLRSVIGKLGCVADQTRPDLAFDLCDLSSRIKNATVQHLLMANKVVIKAKSEHVVLRYHCFDDLRNLKLVTYNDASFGNLKDGGSQGTFVTFIVDPEGNCSPLMSVSEIVISCMMLCFQ